MKKVKNNYQKGFTLIELLVVIAIIGILSSVVLASLNSARQKGQIAAIKSNLKNMIPQAELLYDVPGNYSTVCADSKIISMLATVTNTGSSASCLSYNNSGLSDVNLRWGASAIMGTSTPIKAYSVTPAGVVTWDTQGVNSSGVSVATDITMNWATANNACLINGGRLPTLEELKSLSDATYIASGNTTRTPPGFIANDYWTATTVPSDLNKAYYVYVPGNGVYSYTKTSGANVHCVR